MRFTRLQIFTLALAMVLTNLSYVNCSGMSTAGVEVLSSLSNDPGYPAPSAPTPTPGPTPYPKVGDVPIIPSNFDVASHLQPSWGTGEIAGSGAPDTVGAFRFLCSTSHEAYDDPIVYPGMPGASHLHQFFGNTLANAHSTYESLRTTGESTCGNKVNRSAYWMPAVMATINGAPKVVRPDHITIYYKRTPKNNPGCIIDGVNRCVDLPRGLRMITGYKMSSFPNPIPETSAHSLENTSWHGQHNFSWRCYGKNPAGEEYSSEKYRSLANLRANFNCLTGGSVEISTAFAHCWDGVNLDTPDHRSHVVHGKYGSWGYYKCPDTHPWQIPTFTLKATYRYDSPLEFSTWHLSSDHMNGQSAPAGSTFHTDWFGAWDDSVMEMWHDGCIEDLLNCSGGDLGNGLQIVGAEKPFPNVYYPKLNSWTAPERYVDPPPHPTMVDHSKMNH